MTWAWYVDHLRRLFPDRSWPAPGDPQKQPRPAGFAASAGDRAGCRPLECNTCTDSIAGFISKVGSTQAAWIGPDRELITTEDNLSVILGCGHRAGSVQDATEKRDKNPHQIGGQCHYCAIEYGKLLAKGKISIFDAERLSLVCSDCAKITTSGLLCCPKHYVKLTGADGQEIYLDREQACRLDRQRTAAMVLGFLAGVFGDRNHQPRADQQESKKDA